MVMPTASTAEFCEDLFESLVTSDPELLIALLGSRTMAPSDLTFAAEIAGRIADSDRVRPALIRLLYHPDPVVREGAIYGLARHVDARVRAEMCRVVEFDPNPAVRKCAAEIIYSFLR